MVRVLVVEDERVVAWEIQESLYQFGHVVIGNETTGEAAIRIAKEKQPDVVLMDICLQGPMDGITAAETIQNQLQLPVVFLTAYADTATLERAVGTLPFGYLVKPFQPVELHTTLEAAVRRHQSEVELRRSERQATATLRSLGDGAIAINCAGQITFFNAVAESLTGWPQSEVLGRNIHDILPVYNLETGQLIDHPLLLALTGDTVHLPDNSGLQAKNGERRPISDSAAPICDAQGGVIGSVMVFQETATLSPTSATQLEAFLKAQTVRLERSLRFEATLKRVTDKVRDYLDEHHILEAVVEEVAQALAVKGCNASLYDRQRETARINFEYTLYATPFLGKEISMANFPQGYAQLLAGQGFQFCSLYPHPERAQVALLAWPIQDNEGVLGDLWVVHDANHEFDDVEIRLVQQISTQCAIAIRQSRLYTAAQTQIEEMEKLNRLKDDFLSTISHELRTPVTNIELATRMLSIQLQKLGLVGETDNTLQRYLDILTKEGQRETKLINDLLDLSISDMENPTLTPTAVDLHEWLPTFIRPFQRQAKEGNKSLSLTIAPNIPALITDRHCLGRIIEQLLDNACKYTPTDGAIALAVQVQADQICFRVTNTGVDIPPAEQERIFDKFYRIPNSNPWQHAGAGLGLALVKKLTQQIGGTITLDSANHQTTFILTLPQLQA